MSQRRVHYVLSTHWDREWYQAFQDYRYRLVQTLDAALAGLADGRLTGPFQTDGQAIILEDYLEVRPERDAQVRQFAQDGRLAIGPWYVLPDEWLVSGESIIRNIRMGRAVARSFGATPADAGFVCDLFGHISQLPQILAGFGVRGGFLWRGINDMEHREVRWRGADGTELPCYLFGKRGYVTYAAQVRGAAEFDTPCDPAAVVEGLRAYLAEEARCSQVGPLLAFDGGDHQAWDEPAYQVLMDYAAKHAAGEGYEIIHSTLDQYLAEMLPHAERIETVVEGELREPALLPGEVDESWLIPGVLASRVWIKQANDRCQTLLCHWAEPMAVLSSQLTGAAYPAGFLEVAWRWLLKNHPHDSICGCSIDTVHEDMKFRFSQSRQIAERLRTESTRQIAARIEGPIADNELRVTVFNPLARPLAETVDLTLEVPAEWPTFQEFFGFEAKPAFRIYDEAGNELAYQRLGQTMSRTLLRLKPARMPTTAKVHRVRVALPLRIAGLGYTTLTVRAGTPHHHTRHPDRPGLATSERSIANEHVEVVVEPNGSVTLTDRRSGERYERLLTFEDTADIGDGWWHGVAVNDQTFTSTACAAEVALVDDTPELATLRVRTRMSVPEAFNFDDTMTRSERRVELVIDSRITLRRGAQRVEVETTVHNHALDHRLRLLLPSGAKADTYLTESTFDVVERPIALRQDNHRYRELEVETKPQQAWAAVFDKRRGLAVISEGLHEVTVRDLPERPIALTLLRSTRRTVMTDGEPNGQIQGELRFRYWIVPGQGEPDRTRLCYLGQQLAAGVATAQLRQRDLADLPEPGRLPASAGLFEVEGDAVLTACQQVDGHTELRFFNPTTSKARATLRSLAAQPPKRVQPVSFEGQPQGDPIDFAKGAAAVELGPKQIVTLRLVD